MSRFLKYRSVIYLEGKDSKDFLQSIFTNDIYKVADNNIEYSLLLTPQGKLLYDFFIFKDQERIYLDCHAKFLDDIKKKLMMYKLHLDVNFFDSNLLVFISKNKLGKFSFADPRNNNLGYRNYITDKINKADEEIQDNNFYYDELRLKYVVPEMGIDFLPEEFFPLDLNMKELGAISFDKGCYVGQEVTARVNYRGKRKKSLKVLPINEYQVDDELKKDGRVIGKVLKIYKESAFVITK